MIAVQRYFYTCFGLNLGRSDLSVVQVAIVRGEKPENMTVKALEMAGAHKTLLKTKPVLIKPNYINASHPSTGITTDSRVVEGIVKFLRENSVEDVTIGEGAGFADTFRAFRVAGLDVVAERWNVRLVDLNKDEFVQVEPEEPLALKKVNIAKTALESTIISVPKLKPHRLARVTLGLKNMMGVMSPKGSMHNHLSEKIVDLVSVIKPSVAVIDGLIAGQGHETAGDPVRMDLVIAGTDPVSVDAVGAAVMGIPPESVKHLRLAEERGLGVCDLKRIEVLGDPIEKVSRKLKTSFLSNLFVHLG